MSIVRDKRPIQVLFVCLGNICRSPTAQGVFADLVANAGLSQRIAVDSAGTGDWHVGRPPDPRSQQAALSRGYQLAHLRARQVTAGDFERFHYILAMDQSNLDNLRGLCPENYEGVLDLFLSFTGESSGIDEVPDPYSGGAKGFLQVLDLVEDATQGLLAHIRRDHLD